MPNNAELQQIVDELKNKVAMLTSDIGKLKQSYSRHIHTGYDDSSLIKNAEITAKSIVVSSGQTTNNLVVVPLTIIDGTIDGGTNRRSSGMALGTLNKSTSGEIDQFTLVVGKDSVSGQQLTLSESQNFSKFNESQIQVQHLPNDTNNPPFSFFTGFRTPLLIQPSGAITNGGATLTDTKLNITGNLAGCVLDIMDGSGNLLESHTIASNTATVITINGTWASATASYAYLVYGPMFLGSATSPWRRLYTQTDIRFGIGPTSGTAVATITVGNGSPNGVVTANLGSLYLNMAGGAGTSLYVKETGVQTNTGWVGK